jgi:hypothetical protein
MRHRDTMPWRDFETIFNLCASGSFGMLAFCLGMG